MPAEWSHRPAMEYSTSSENEGKAKLGKSFQYNLNEKSRTQKLHKRYGHNFIILVDENRTKF